MKKRMGGGMKKIATYSFKIPTWAVTAIEYGDDMGITAEESQDLNDFQDRLSAITKKLKAHSYVIYYNEDPYFSWRNDISGDQGADVVDATVTFLR